MTCIVLDGWALKLLSSLPALASFEAALTSSVGGSEATLAEWLAVSSKRDGKKRQKDQDDEEVKEEDASGRAAIAGDEANAREDARLAFDQRLNGGRENPTDPSLPQRHSPLLLFFNALASKPSFVYLRLLDNARASLLSPFVMEHMPVWPHLLCLSVTSGSLQDYHIAPHCFPSLTSLSFPNCSDASIKQLVRLPKLEELRLPQYTPTRTKYGGVRTTESGFCAFSRAACLRAVQYVSPEGHDMEPPSLAALTALFTLTNLTRLTATASWLPEHVCVPLLTQHRFENLRCLELIEQDSAADYLCPQSNAALLPLVQPAHMIVAGREERQAARAAKRQGIAVERGSLSGNGAESEDFPANNAANFPALECLALPYWRYNIVSERTGQLSVWMRQQLRRIYSTR